MKTYTAYNLHTHSEYCGHGTGKLEEYCIAALSQGIELLGFSEHCPLPDRRFSSSRMDNSQMTIYEKDARERDIKHDSLKVLVGYECDYSPEYISYYRELLDSNRVDYLITGTHFIKTREGRYTSIFTNPMDSYGLKQYADTLLGAINSKLFSFVAHPDLFLSAFNGRKEEAMEVALEIIRCAKKSNLPLEINGNGMLKPKIGGSYQYPKDEFWYLVEKEEAPVVMYTDSHTPSSLIVSYRLIKEYSNKFKLKLVYPEFTDNKLSFREL